ncbi:MAG: SDR family oxidoreductase [Bdellovibrionales bacterium]|nr:SDR family oxidoreductase [Bdellovibrionales bacterium]
MKIAVVTGANRGLGKGTALELADRGYHVILVGRNEKELHLVEKEIKSEGQSAEIFVSDVTDEGRIRDLAKHIEKKHGHLDLLVNNAGVFLDGEFGSGPTFKTVPPETILETFETNVLGPYCMIQNLIPLIEKSKSGRIVNVSSGMGGLTEMEGGYPGYRISKTALNALTRNMSKDLSGTKIRVNSVCPGWVKTDMGGSNATRQIAEGVQSILWAADVPDSGPTGGYFRDGKAIAW